MASFSKRGLYWRAQIRAKGQDTISRTFDTKAQAQAWARSVENEMDRGVFVDRRESEQTTLAEAIERYKREIIPLKAHPKQECQRVDRWLQNPLAKRYLATLRGFDFAKYRDSRRAEGRAENTIRLELQAVSHIFVIARKEWGMENLTNPVSNIRKPSGSKERDRRLLPGEYDLIHGSLSRSENPYAAPAFDLAIETSLRQGMLHELCWDWVDFDKRVIHIPQRYRNIGNKGVPVAVPLSTKAVSVLRAMPRAISGRILDCSANAIRVLWNRRLKELGIKGLRWHDLRHESASRLFECGLHPMQVASITGHKNLNMLRRYTHLKAEDLVAMLG